MTTARTRKTAPAKPKAKFSLTALAAETDLQPFEFEFEGQDWTLEHLQAIDSGEVQALQNKFGSADNITGGLALIELVMGPEQYAEFRQHRLPLRFLNALIGAYNEHSGTNVGESQDS